MNVEHVSLHQETLSKACPFYFALNQELVIVQEGAALKKLFPDLHAASFSSQFFISDPYLAPKWDLFLEHQEKKLFLQAKHKPIAFQAMFLFDPAAKLLFVLATPNVHSVQEMQTWGISTADFPSFDTTTTYLEEIGIAESELQKLQDLSQVLAKKEEELKQKEEQLAMALEGSSDGLFDWNLSSNALHYSPRWSEMLGYHFGEIKPQFSSVEKLVHVEDFLRFEGALEIHFRYGETFEVESRWRTRGGKWKWILTRGKVVEWDKEGNPLRMVGVNSDIDQRKRSEEDLKGVHNRLIDAIEILDMGFVIFDKEERLVVCNSQYRQMYTEAKDLLVSGTPYETILRRLIECVGTDLEKMEQEQWIAQKIAYHRNPGHQREERWKGRWVRIQERRTREGGIVSILSDVTEKVATNEHLKRFREIVESTYDGVCSFDLEGVITSWNPACFAIFGYTPQEAISEHISMIIPEKALASFTSIVDEILRGELTTTRVEASWETKSREEVYVSLTISKIVDTYDHTVGISLIITDISERKRIEKELKRRDALLRGVSQASNYLLTEPDFFIAVGMGLASVGEAAKVQAVTLQLAKQTKEEHTCYMWDKGVKRSCDKLTLTKEWERKLRNGGIIAKSKKECSLEELDCLTKESTETFLLLPLISEGDFLGSLIVEEADPERVWLESEVTILCTFTAALGGAFARKKAEDEVRESQAQLAHARKKEIDIGFRIQKSLLLGKAPENLRGMDVYPITIASQGVDGDFYDFFSQSRDQFDLLIGDVMGKGIPAALLGAATKSAFNHALTTLTTRLKGERTPEPQEVVGFVHEQVTKEMIDLESFMTICYARFSMNAKTMTYVDCGHTNTLFFKQKDKQLLSLPGKNVPLGFVEEEVYVQEVVKFEEGDVFVFYSDGITEARSSEGAFFGLSRLQKIIKDAAHFTGKDIVKKIIQEVEAFAGLGQLEDDLTCIAVKIEEKELLLEYIETLRVEASLRVLEKVRFSLQRFFQRLPHKRYQQALLLELELAANEVLTNIIRHAVPDRPQVMVQLIMEMFQDRVRIHFDYPGQSFMPKDVTAPVIERMQVGGFGLYIIETLADDVTYRELEPGKQRVSLTKYL